MPAEQFANLAETTLASGYTSGTTTLSVASSSGFPSVGPFRVRLGNTGKTIWRVDSVSGTTWTGAAEANDANAASSDSVKIVASSQVAERMLQSPSTGEIHTYTGVSGADRYGPIWKLAPLDQSGWSWVNQGAWSVTQGSGVVWLHGAATGAGLNVKIRETAAPSTPYTITAAVIPWHSSASGSIAGGGICMRESGTGKILEFILDRGVLVLNKNTSPTVFSSQPVNRAGLGGAGPIVFLRMNDGGTNITFGYSIDGVNFQTVFTEGRTVFMAGAPDKVGIVGTQEGSGALDAGVSILSWVQS